MARLAVVAVVVAAVAGLAWWSMTRAAPDDLETVVERVRGEYPDVPRLTVDELAARLEAGEEPLLLDTRTAEEYAVSHLEGAVHAESEDEVLAAIAEAEAAGGGDREVILYCSVGYRSARLASRLGAAGHLEAGHPEVMNLEGSIFAWANSGRPVYRDGRRVAKVHPYDARWGKLLRPDLRADP